MDYLELYKKFKDIKDIAEYIDEVEKLRSYYNSQQYFDMRLHIDYLTKKYPIETIAWNSKNVEMPNSFFQEYQNAESFMKLQGAKLITSKVINYQNYLSQEEKNFIKTMIKFIG